VKAPALLLVIGLLGCASGQVRTDPAPPIAASALPTAAGVAASPANPRQLPAHATFADVVDAARAVDDESQPNAGASAHAAERSGSGCLLDLRAAPSLAGDILVGARPLASAPEELATPLLRAAGPAAVVSAWGSTPGEAEVALVAFTTTSSAAARRPAIAAIATLAGVFLRSADSSVRAHPEAMPVDAAGTLLSQLPGPAVVYVSAEAAVPLDALARLLRVVPNRFEVALAVALPKGTRLPPTAAAADSGSELLCPAGLPEPAPDAAEGELEPAGLRQALAPLEAAALSCALTTGGQALSGGRLVLGLRIDPDGRARTACLVSDAIGEVLLRRCVVRAARGLALPKPSPAGFVDVHLPLELTLVGPSPQRPLCE